jgi:hypothetical protein
MMGRMPSSYGRTVAVAVFVFVLTFSPSAHAADTIDYVATDQNGLTATTTRTVIIQAANDNTPPLDTSTTTTETTTTQ